MWGETTGAAVVDVHLPNLFGEHGRPGYNSVVATFSHELATGGQARRSCRTAKSRLLHVQDAVDQMLFLAENPTSTVVSPAGRVMSVSSVLALLTEFRDLYATGDIPEIADPFRLAMFNTYRSFCFPDQFPMHPSVASRRPGLPLRVRHGPTAARATSSSRPATLGSPAASTSTCARSSGSWSSKGTAEIRLRRLFDDEVVRFAVSGDEPAIVDMPTMWAHSITNAGNTELMTLFWANEILDPRPPRHLRGTG